MVMMVVVVMMMPVLVFVFVSVVFAAIRGGGQSTAQKCRHQFFHGRPRSPGAHRDSMLVEVGQRTPANAPGNDRLDSRFPQPARECARLVLRRGEYRGVEYGLLLGVDLNHGKLTAAAEMIVETSVLNWNGDLHRCVRSVAPSGE